MIETALVAVVCGTCAVGAMLVLRWWRVRLGRAEDVARACHEIRGPLAAARLGLELSLVSAHASPSRLRAIELELERAAVALDDLEGIHRLPAGELVDVEMWLTESLEAWRPAAALRGVEVRLQWRGPRALVRGQRARLAQVSGNLIANAIEHGEGFVEVTARVEQGSVRIEVLDGGPGLKATVAALLQGEEGDAKHHLFGPGSRRMKLARPRCKSLRWEEAQGGRRGHGLAIARAVAIELGGHLVSGPSEQGGRLVLELPLASDGPAIRADGHLCP